jgi:hypothetical protein
MDKGKLDIFRGFWKKEPHPLQKELEQKTNELISQAKLMKDLRQHKGWKLFDEFFEIKKKFIAHELKTCSQNQLIRLQEKAKIIDELYAFMNTKIVQDPDL